MHYLGGNPVGPFTYGSPTGPLNVLFGSPLPKNMNAPTISATINMASSTILCLFICLTIVLNYSKNAKHLMKMACCEGNQKHRASVFLCCALAKPASRVGVSRASRRAVALPRAGHQLAAPSAECASLRCSTPLASQAVGLLRGQSKTPCFGVFVLCPREESNLDYKIRNLASYPLNDKGFFKLCEYIAPSLIIQPHRTKIPRSQQRYPRMFH